VKLDEVITKAFEMDDQKYLNYFTIIFQQGPVYLGETEYLVDKAYSGNCPL
jgi:hypothetical protein